MCHFSNEWHDTLDKRESLLNDIESAVHKLGYELSLLPNLPNYMVDPSTLLPEGADHTLRLAWAAGNIDMVRRKTLVRSVLLEKSFITEFNEQNYPAVPLLLRALLEEGCHAIYHVERLKPLFQKYRKSSAQDDWKTLSTEITLTLYGSRANQFNLWTNIFIRHKDSPASTQELAAFLEEEVGTALALGEREAYSVTERNSSDYAWFATNILTIIANVGKILYRENRLEKPSWLPTIYSWLSEASHPTANSWRLNVHEVLEGCLQPTSDEKKHFTRVAAITLYARVAEAFVIKLPLYGVYRLTSLLGEVTSDLDALRGSRLA